MKPEDPTAEDAQTVEQACRPLTRRDFLGGAAASAIGIGAAAAALQPLAALDRENLTLDAFLQRHYRQLGPEEMGRILDRLERECERGYGVRPEIKDVRPRAGTEFAYALNLGRCIGCRRCARACIRENNQSRDSADDINMSYIRVLELEKGGIDLEGADHYYDGEKVPRPGKYYMPVQCHQCRSAPCTKVCPVRATWQEPDGIVVIDYNWCIGCRYCMAACPYDARRFNYSRPKLEAADIHTHQAYLGNRIRPKGVVEKCTFCLHRTREGRYPACLEACPTGARIFGNLLDPESEINHVLREKRVYVLKEDVGTHPKFYYFFDK